MVSYEIRISFNHPLVRFYNQSRFILCYLFMAFLFLKKFFVSKRENYQKKFLIWYKIYKQRTKTKKF